MMHKAILLAIVLALLNAATPADPALHPAMGASASSDPPKAARWYSLEQVERGKGVYARHCASCHGADAMGTRVGTASVPPLDGSGHSSHHGLDQMLEQVAKGTIITGGSMPPFAAVLDESEQRAAIAWMQSLRPDEVYREWQENYGGGHRH